MTIVLNPKLLPQSSKSPQQLVKWFQQNQRSFPWREEATKADQDRGILRDPYRVLVSEVMLQQTRASVVIDYFQRFLNKWPTISHLSQALEEDVVKIWEGLGYYRRARSLRKTAQVIEREYQGQFPQDLKTLQSIPGIGPYTAGAILSLAFNQRVSALDANALRVLARFYGIRDSIDQVKTKREIDALWQIWSAPIEPALANEALIELGAIVCKGSGEPSCTICPLRQNCKALQQGIVDILPVKKGRPQTEVLYRPTLILKGWKDGKTFFLVRHVDQQKLMQGLYEWPFLEWDEPLEPEQAQAVIQNKLGKTLQPLCSLSPVTHTFTRFKAHLYPVVHEETFTMDSIQKLEGIFSEKGKSLRLLDRDQMKKIPFCSGHKTLFERVQRKHQPGGR